jgi:ATP-dependent RNA helicase DHX37/DHR1
LEVDEEGKPVLKKRIRRGGVKSKLSFKHEAPEEPEWTGFSSASEMDSDTDEEASAQECDDISDASDNEQQDSASESKEESGDEAETETEETDESDEEEDSSPKQQRSSAFKAWANQQLNEALGYQPSSNIANATDTLLGKRSVLLL